jgi:hypothetical protein
LQELAVVEAEVMLAFEEARPFVLAADHVSRHGEQVEIVRSQGSRLVGAGQ